MSARRYLCCNNTTIVASLLLGGTGGDAGDWTVAGADDAWRRCYLNDAAGVTASTNDERRTTNHDYGVAGSFV
jgi:hypothetical protein